MRVHGRETISTCVCTGGKRSVNACAWKGKDKHTRVRRRETISTHAYTERTRQAHACARNKLGA
eukprot:1794891-Rhodomonas_salina.2